jgi:hypothetical protein
VSASSPSAIYLVGAPVANSERVGDDLCARFEHEKFVAKPVEVGWQQKQREHRRVGEIGLEHVGLHECLSITDPFLGRGALRQRDQVGLNSTPRPWAPRFAAAITLRPSPDPRRGRRA